MESLQIRLKQKRLELGLTQTEISEKLGMKQATYQKLESGKTPDMRISTLMHICKTLRISSDWLLGIEENPEKLLEKAQKRAEETEETVNQIRMILEEFENKRIEINVQEGKK